MTKQIQTVFFLISAGIVLGVMIPFQWLITSMLLLLTKGSSSLTETFFETVGQSSVGAIATFEFFIVAVICTLVAVIVAVVRHGRPSSVGSGSVAVLIFAICAAHTLKAWSLPKDSMNRACQIMNETRDELKGNSDSAFVALTLSRRAMYATGTAAHPRVHWMLSKLVPALAYADHASKVNIIFQALDELEFPYKNCSGFLFMPLGPNEVDYDKAYEAYKAEPK